MVGFGGWVMDVGVGVGTLGIVAWLVIGLVGEGSGVGVGVGVCTLGSVAGVEGMDGWGNVGLVVARRRIWAIWMKAFVMDEP